MQFTIVVSEVVLRDLLLDALYHRCRSVVDNSSFPRFLFYMASL
jgi:hypothetical protein